MRSTNPVLKTLSKDGSDKTDKTHDLIPLRKMIPKWNHDNLGQELVEFLTFVLQN